MREFLKTLLAIRSKCIDYLTGLFVCEVLSVILGIIFFITLGSMKELDTSTIIFFSIMCSCWVIIPLSISLVYFIIYVCIILPNRFFNKLSDKLNQNVK